MNIITRNLCPILDQDDFIYNVMHREADAEYLKMKVQTGITDRMFKAMKTEGVDPDFSFEQVKRINMTQEVVDVLRHLRGSKLGEDYTERDAHPNKLKWAVHKLSAMYDSDIEKVAVLGGVELIHSLLHANNEQLPVSEIITLETVNLRAHGYAIVVPLTADKPLMDVSYSDGRYEGDDYHYMDYHAIIKWNGADFVVLEKP